MTLNRMSPAYKLFHPPFRPQPEDVAAAAHSSASQEAPSPSAPEDPPVPPLPPPDTAAPVIQNARKRAATPAKIPSQSRPPAQSSLQTDPSASVRRADILCLTEVQHRPVEWLWQDRLASGALAMLSADIGTGKTWIALAIAAALSRGRVPFSGEALEPCTVLYASTGTAASEVIRPRFAKLDGDPSRLLLLRGVVPAASEQSASFSLGDTAVIEDALERTRARLLIVDPLHSFFGTGVNLSLSGETRPVLDRLALLADKHRCCILLVRHLGKRGRGSVVSRGLGPVELSGAVRTEFLAGSSPDAPSQPALVQIKSNLGPLAPALGYSIEHDGVFTWTGLSKLTPEELLSARATGAGQPQRKFAGEWLRQNLQKNGSRSQYRIELDAQRDGVSIATLRRSKLDLGVISVKDGLSGPWYWSLPPAGQNQSAT